MDMEDLKKQITATFDDWDDAPGFTQSDVFEGIYKPFIIAQIMALAELDEQRAAWTVENLPSDYQMTYVFHEHAARVAKDVHDTVLFMGLPEYIAEILYWAVLPHDCGKAQLPVSLWDMVEKPEDDIKAQRRSHTDLGMALTQQALSGTQHPFGDLMLDIMQYHHEQMDGTGHKGLKGEQLSAIVRLVCIVEGFDGYCIPRPHFGDRDVSVPGVLTRMKEEKGENFYDMNLLEIFADMKLQRYKEEQSS